MSWATTPVIISIKPTGPEVETLAQLGLCLSQIVQLCDGHGGSLSLFLSLQPSPRHQCGRSVDYELISTETGGVRMAWFTFLEQNSQIPSTSANSCPGTHCLGLLTNLLFIISGFCFHPSKHTRSPGFWLHVFANLLTAHSLKLTASALVVADH